MSPSSAPSSTPSGELRVAVIGFGLSGQIYHAPLIDAVEGLRVAAVVTSNPQRSAIARSRYPEVSVFDTPADLFENADDIDMAVVATPNSSHAAHAIAAIEHGMPTVVDKPFARTVAEADMVRSAAAEYGTLLSVYHNRRWDGDFLTVLDMAQDDRLGEIHRFESRIDRWIPTVSQGWRDSAEADTAGGMLYDLGSHLIDQALTLFGPAASVYAETARCRAGALVDDEFFVAIRHESGQCSHLGASLSAPRPAPRFRLIGNLGTYEQTGNDPQGDQIKAGLVPRSTGWGVAGHGQHGTLYVDGAHTDVPTRPGDYCVFYESFRDAVFGVSDNPVTAESATAVVRVIEAARRSAAGA